MNRLKARILKFLPEEKKFLYLIYSKFIDDHAYLWSEVEDIARLRYILSVIIRLFYEEHKHLQDINQVDQQEFNRAVRELIVSPDALMQKAEKSQIKAIDRLGVERWFNAFRNDIEKINGIIVRYEKEKSEIIEEFFNPEDLSELRRLAQTEISHGNKLVYFQRLLKEQRTLRDPLHIKQLIAVHITNYFPDNGLIKTRGQFKTELYEGVEVQFPRETIHFSLNGPVGSHMYGDWSDYKYAILIPVPNIIDRIINISPQDTFIFGELELPKDSEVLGRLIDVQGKYSGNARLIIVPKETNLHDAVINRIRQRGYTPMSIGMWSWSTPATKEDAEALKEFLDLTAFDIDSSDSWEWTRRFNKLSEELGKEIGAHSGTFWTEVEETAEWAYNLLTSDEQVGIDAVNSCKHRIVEILVELRKRTDKLTSPKEREAYLRTQQLFKKLYKDLKSKYPEGFKRRDYLV